MYRIQAYNFVKKQMIVLWADCMVKRQRIIAELIASGEFAPAGITYESLPRMARGA